MQLYIKNFQGISEMTVDLTGFTVLTGKSNSGKSSVRRALDTVLYNNWDLGFLKVGETHCVIKLTIDEKNYIQITKPENTYTVMVDGVKSVYPKVGKNTLEELDALGLDYFYDSEDYYHNVHIRKQTDPWYFITSSNQEQSRIIASIFNFDEIKNILKQSYRDKADTVSEADKLNLRLDELKIEGQNLHSKLNILNRLKGSMSEQGSISEYDLLNRDIESKKLSWSSISVLKNKHSRTIGKLNSLSILKEYVQVQNSICSANKELDYHKKEIKRHNNQIKIVKQILANKEQEDIVQSYLQNKKAVKICSNALASTVDELNKLKLKIKVAKGTVEHFNNVHWLQEFIKGQSQKRAKDIELKDIAKQLKLTATSRNKAVRFNSLSNYIARTKSITEIKANIQTNRQSEHLVVDDLIALKAAKEFVAYLEDVKTFDKKQTEVLNIREQITDIGKQIKKYQKELNLTVVCPHCSEPIGEFVKELHCQS